LLEPAVALGRPVSYGAFAYTTPPGHPPARDAVAWWGDMEFLPHFWGLLNLPSIEMRLVFADAPLSAPTRHELAGELQRSVAAILPASAA